MTLVLGRYLISSSRPSMIDATSLREAGPRCQVSQSYCLHVVERAGCFPLTHSRHLQNATLDHSIWKLGAKRYPLVKLHVTSNRNWSLAFFVYRIPSSNLLTRQSSFCTPVGLSVTRLYVCCDLRRMMLPDSLGYNPC